MSHRRARLKKKYIALLVASCLWITIEMATIDFIIGLQVKRIDLWRGRIEQKDIRTLLRSGETDHYPYFGKDLRTSLTLEPTTPLDPKKSLLSIWIVSTVFHVGFLALVVLINAIFS